MAEPIRPKFCVGPSWPQERFITNQNFQKLNPNKNKFSFGFKNHDFFLKIRKKKFFLQCKQSENVQLK